MMVYLVVLAAVVVLDTWLTGLWFDRKIKKEIDACDALVEGYRRDVRDARDELAESHRSCQLTVAGLQDEIHELQSELIGLRGGEL